MVLQAANEKFIIGDDVLLGDKGTAIRQFNEVIYCDPAINYTSNFGFQWNLFDKTQVDRFQHGLSQSRDRFFSVTRWRQEDLSNQKILEVGSGAGRFTSIVLEHTRGELFSVDYSDAVSANFKNNGPHPRLRLFQASIYQLPFAEQQFDKVFCFGVIQHTPDVKKSVKCLTEMVRPGGELIVDFYPRKGWYTQWHAKYWLRPLTKKMDHRKLLGLIDRNAGRLIRVYNGLTKMGLRSLTRFLPVCDIHRTIPLGLKPETLREWVVLDTFDMFSPAFDQPQRLEDVVEWFKEFGMKEVKGEVISYGSASEVTVVRGIRK